MFKKVIELESENNWRKKPKGNGLHLMKKGDMETFAIIHSIKSQDPRVVDEYGNDENLSNPYYDECLWFGPIKNY